mmetsp:Transcript_1137/g.3508  ORF Transcript_1137/g.3508 Transcript_1137/m.3508 type:complete len:269 (+) Transcript_1137:934-1740(+)
MRRRAVVTRANEALGFVTDGQAGRQQPSIGPPNRIHRPERIPLKVLNARLARLLVLDASAAHAVPGSPRAVSRAHIVKPPGHPGLFRLGALKTGATVRSRRLSVGVHRPWPPHLLRVHKAPLVLGTHRVVVIAVLNDRHRTDDRGTGDGHEVALGSQGQRLTIEILIGVSGDRQALTREIEALREIVGERCRVLPVRGRVRRACHDSAQFPTAKGTLLTILLLILLTSGASSSGWTGRPWPMRRPSHFSVSLARCVSRKIVVRPTSSV